MTMSMTMIFVVLTAVGIGVTLLIGHYWVGSNTSDKGTMSRQWLAEYNQSHP